MNRKTMLSKSIVRFSIAIIFSLTALAQTPRPALDPSQIASYEGQTVTSVELAGRPDLEIDGLASRIAQHSGEPFSREKAEATVRSLKSTGQFEDVQLDVRPEPEGPRVLFVLQPAIYF